MSDLHQEFDPMWRIPVMEGEKDQILLLLGDIGLAASPNTYMGLLKDCSSRFKEIIYLMGNHEHYGKSLLRSALKIRDNIFMEGGMFNFHVIDQREIIRIGDISFICATLWTSYFNNNPDSMLACQFGMNDYRTIRTGPKNNPYQRKILPEDLYEIFLKDMNFIFENIPVEKAKGQKVVVLTHHAPSLQSIHPDFHNGIDWLVNGGYASSLDQDIIDTSPVLWGHGHTHVSFDYMIELTRVICNPCGYRSSDKIGFNPNFNPFLTIEL